MNELFSIPETLSPKLAWMKRNNVHTMKVSAKPELWFSWKGNHNNSKYLEEGKTEQEAIAALAIKLKIPLWNEEGFNNQPLTNSQK